MRRGFTKVDLVGGVDHGVFRFKTSFGGREVPYLAADTFIGPDALRRTAKRLRAAIAPAHPAPPAPPATAQPVG